MLMYFDLCTTIKYLQSIYNINSKDLNKDESLKKNMDGSELYCPLPYTFPIFKIKAVESSLQQTLSNFKDLVTEIELLNSENKYLKSLHETDKGNKESVSCCNCETLQIEVISKEQTLDSLITVIRKLCDTQDISALQSIKDLIWTHTKISKENIQDNANNFQNVSPKKNINNESICEIEGTPTGRTSPIIRNKKGKIQLSLKDKKKCPEEWLTPETKNIKLSFPTPRTKPSGRLKQARLSLIKIKNTNVVDLTSSPEYTGRSYSESHDIQEVLDIDETILPSPTSGPIDVPFIYKSICKDSPSKLNKLQMAMKIKFEADANENIQNNITTNVKDVEDSVNLLQNYTKRLKSPKCVSIINPYPNESVSLLNLKKTYVNTNTSTNRRPLLEDRNVINTRDTVSDMSVYKGSAAKNVTESKPFVEPLYKEPVVRKKAEKRALPGWSCDECRDFFDELYKYNPEMLAKKMDECSKHRGRNNPARPKTPEGFWNPRWDVPEDTEEFNRRNNV